jgi:hypothetical protein
MRRVGDTQGEEENFIRGILLESLKVRFNLGHLSVFGRTILKLVL